MASTQRKTLKAGSTLHTLITDVIFVVALLVIWELVAKAHVFGPNSEVIFPTLEQVGAAFVRNFSYGYAGTSLWVYVADSMMLLLEGFGNVYAISCFDEEFAGEDNWLLVGTDGSYPFGGVEARLSR